MCCVTKCRGCGLQDGTNFWGLFGIIIICIIRQTHSILGWWVWACGYRGDTSDGWAAAGGCELGPSFVPRPSPSITTSAPPRPKKAHNQQRQCAQLANGAICCTQPRCLLRGAIWAALVVFPSHLISTLFRFILFLWFRDEMTTRFCLRVLSAIPFIFKPLTAASAWRS